MFNLLINLITKALGAWRVAGSVPIEWVQRPDMFRVLFLGVLVQVLMGQQAIDQGHGVMALLWLVLPLLVAVIAVFTSLRSAWDTLLVLWIVRPQRTTPRRETGQEQRASCKGSRFVLARARDCIP